MVRLHVFGGIPMNRRRPTEGSNPSIVQLKVELYFHMHYRIAYGAPIADCHCYRDGSRPPLTNSAVESRVCFNSGDRFDSYYGETSTILTAAVSGGPALLLKHIFVP